jgi:murein DD-endopeptidase MepM/ murein hydrolase activator NlpD
MFRRAVAGAAILALLPTASAGAASDPVAEAEARVTAAREAAFEASQAYAAGETREGELDASVRSTREALVQLEAQAEDLRAVARQRALIAYTGSTYALDDFLSNGDDVLDVMRRNELLDGVNEKSNDALEQLGAITDELEVRRRDLESQLEEQRAIVEDLRARNEELQAALQEATEAEQALKERLAREQRAREYAARLAAARAAADAAIAARNAAEDDDGGGGGGSPGQIIGSGSWVCPVQGAVAFSDSWGAPRSGGRSHQGVDMMASTGTPVVAVVSGSIRISQGSLQGNGLWLNGSDGHSYFYAHLNDYVGGARSVSAGELIGHVGSTGNAQGGAPHLHFEIHPGGGAAVNPYPTVRSHC